MAKSKENEVKGDGARPLPGLLKAGGEKLLPLLVSGASLLGFVAFAGSVVLWTRFFSLRVPPDQVVDAVPRGEALAIGSAMLLLFGFFGAIATIAVYLIDRGGRATQGMSRAVLLILAVEGIAAIWIVGGRLDGRIIASEVLLLALGGILWATFTGGLIRIKEVQDFEGDEETQEIGDRAFRKSGGKSGVPPRRVLLALAIAAGLAPTAFLVTSIAGGETLKEPGSSPSGSPAWRFSRRSPFACSASSANRRKSEKNATGREKDRRDSRLSRPSDGRDGARRWIAGKIGCRDGEGSGRGGRRARGARRRSGASRRDSSSPFGACYASCRSSSWPSWCRRRS